MQGLSLKTKNIICLGLSTFILTISNTSHAQNFYKWTDKNGSTHYTRTPPPNSAKKVSKVTTYSDYTTYVAPAQQATSESDNNQQNSQNFQQNRNNEVDRTAK